ncbi:hypothetical protein [Lentzea aerocolonigenes]|uniref:hypothetical protein n=1 Tax=Lentzea aerocolonigenes TaxID=68170 RepID=UPI0004C4776F|nr:hypothetical protein [Lentzea aerocolonigenes]MCP2244581.1 hypothetical protein [Lentzea aerocolonigenes]
MGMWSQVTVRGLECPRCRHVGDNQVQIHFGGCNLQEFEIGDSLEWGVYNRGERGHRLVVTEGYGEDCPGCGSYLYDVYIENDVITCVTWNDGTFTYTDLPGRKDGSRFYVLDDYPPHVQR